MRFHVSGVGSIGSLVAFHLQRSTRAHANLRAAAAELPNAFASGSGSGQSSSSSNEGAGSSSVLGSSAPGLATPHLAAPHVHGFLPDPSQTHVTLHLRHQKPVGRPEFMALPPKEDDSIIVERDGARFTERDFHIQRHAPITLLQPPPAPKARRKSAYSGQDDKPQGICHAQGYASDSIDSLIVTSKADTTLSSLAPLASRLTPSSTIVLLQNGQGVLDLLYEKLFPDPQHRPNFILASTTHGAWRKRRLHVVHAGVGELHFGVVPNALRAPEGYERSVIVRPPGANRALEEEAEARAAAREAADKLREEEGKSVGWEFFRPRTTAQRRSRSRGRAQEVLDLAAIPELPETLTLRHTVAALLAMPLGVQWLPIRQMQLKLMHKLVINACINPLTALADCRNGELYGNAAARLAMGDICREASAVLLAQARDAREGSGSAGGLDQLDASLLDQSLSPSALLSAAEAVARSTAQNFSSMQQDVHNMRGKTEIDFINGYIVGLGRRYGIDTPVNSDLVNLVNFKATLAGRRPGSKL
ncbi:hypothetical protein FA09DRAFT_332053 [Tilletiopsis washingtonensis]|jgi:2-dehydropantoate 2-reductase|uniref:2-dehydropantoate 2-reductase n=1 Tax=Tilletiopsis washingtonensis TaxID=58919 RepID=A0A316Z3C0_9BASI|nr:hypothetical protein FA09DRAFT_332053 [Tilletiopsis washingtonensis]PWN95402.1 hypothetical protein FA09DRAFT_332053 [Tilletiopsis washingtonensis]